MEDFQIRRATVADADIIATQRARMFQDMGDVNDQGFEILQTKSRQRLSDWIATGDYIGWLAYPTDEPNNLVAGAGIQLYPILARPLNPSTVGKGRQATIVNVFTEQAWRRRGLASLLIKEIITWSRQEQLDRLLLHAADEGRSVYERLGFVAGNEMQFRGEP